MLRPLPAAARDRVIAVILGLLIAGSIAGAVARWLGGAAPAIADGSDRPGPADVGAAGTGSVTDPAP